ncbi:uncharacterized protein LOC124289659 isoform X3 [Haliotis rubra]|uniref:uncharacterized protein LOC124289659 isoform X3 n=1 Tax=Haliotis rubra TaxID=36100 RepID=UPI001EE574E0|nr:uncharacterized protein LOC124289659 isoform X3 [Haliotis rubra]
MKMETEEDSDECRSSFSTSSSDEADSTCTAEEDKEQCCSVSHNLPWRQQGNNQTEMHRSVKKLGAIVTDGDIIPGHHAQPVVFQENTFNVEFQGAPKYLTLGEGNKIEQNKRDDKKSLAQRIRERPIQIIITSLSSSFGSFYVPESSQRHTYADSMATYCLTWFAAVVAAILGCWICTGSIPVYIPGR